MKTFSAKSHEVERKWYLVDAENMILGRLSTKIAHILKGKHKPIYTPHVDTGDFVIVINADKIKVTGKKFTDKLYHHHTGYPGGLKTISFNKLIAQKPTKPVEMAIKRMLPRNSLGRDMMKKLKIYAGSEHPHEAQMPTILKEEDIS